MVSLPAPPRIANAVLQREMDQAFPPHAPVGICGNVPLHLVAENEERVQCMSNFVEHGVTSEEQGAEILHQHALEDQALGGNNDINA